MSRGCLRLLSVIGAVAGTAALGHEGEVHGEAAPPATLGQGAAFSSAAYELVLKPTRMHEDHLEVAGYLSDFRTNEPVRKAEVTVELPSLNKSVKLEESTAPGVYRGELPVRPSTPVDLLVAVRSSSAPELFTVNGHRFAKDPEPPADAGQNGRRVWLVLQGLLVLGSVVLLWRRRGGAASAVLVLVLAPVADGHEGAAHQERLPPKAVRSVAEVPLPKEAQFLLGVKTLPASVRELRPRVVVLGTIIPRADSVAELRAGQPGRVLAVEGKLALLGDRVSRGQPLYALEQALGANERSELRSQALRARADLRQASARLTQAEQELARLRGLAGIVSQRELQAAEVAVELAREDKHRARAELDLYEGTPGGLQRQVVSSPIDGVVVQSIATNGGQVVGGEVIVTVVAAERLWLEADIYEPDLPRVVEGAEAHLRLDAYPGRGFEARLVRPGQLVDRVTRTARALFELENPDGLLKPGMLGELSVAVGTPVRVLAVPERAVVEQEGRHFAYVHSAPERFEQREVRLGRRDGEHAEVAEGLNGGERVVTDGVYPLHAARR